MKKIDTPDFVTDAQLDALMDDWFERDGSTFVHKRMEGRLGWEKSLAVDAPYSEYMLAAKDVRELVKRAYSLGRDTLAAMNLPHKVRVVISKDMSSMTSGEEVCLSTGVFDEDSMEIGERLDVFLGLAVHEGCHVLWTDFSVQATGKLQHSILNILEDERIETICGDEKPGFANFLEKTKAYYFDLYYKRVTEKALLERGTLLDKFMDMLLKIVRFPKYLDEGMFIKFYKYLVRIKDILVPYPSSTAECLTAAQKIEKIIYEFYADEMKKRTAESKESFGESSDDPSEGSKVAPSKSLTPTSVEVRAAVSIDAASASFKETGRLLGVSDEKTLSKAVMGDKEFAEVVEGSITLGSSRDVIFTNAASTSTTDAYYDSSYNRVSRFIPAINKVLKSYSQEYRYNLRGMRSGKLDVNKLCEAYQGVPTVYLREGTVTVDDVCVCLLIDESGSMGGSKEVAARDTGVLINEAIGKVPNVDLFIYGHTGDNRRTGTTEITVYREHGFSPRKALGLSAAQHENRDGVAIYEVAKRVRKQTDKPVLMFIISDGAPSAREYRGDKAIAHTKKSVTQVEKMGFFVVQICIEPSYDPALMFKHFVILRNMSTLSLDLSKIIKGSLLRYVKKVSMS